jgi:hypothetical protein
MKLILYDAPLLKGLLRTYSIFYVIVVVFPVKFCTSKCIRIP